MPYPSWDGYATCVTQEDLKWQKHASIGQHFLWTENAEHARTEKDVCQKWTEIETA